MSTALPRYEPRRLPPVGSAPPMWGAWDRRHRDWVRGPGDAEEPTVFASTDHVDTWAAKQAPR